MASRWAQRAVPAIVGPLLLVSVPLAAYAWWSDSAALSWRRADAAVQAVPQVAPDPLLVRRLAALEFPDVVPVVTYHRVSSHEAEGQYTTHPAQFAEHIAALAAAGYTAVALDDVVRLTTGEAVDLPDKPILITLDDGYQTDFTVVDPILERYGMRATSFLPTGSLGHWPHLSVHQVRQMDASGRWDFGGHSDRHATVPTAAGDDQPALANLLVRPDGRVETLAEWRARVDAELARSQQRLVEVLGHPAAALAYPFNGAYGNSAEVSADLPAALRHAGYRMAFTNSKGAPAPATARSERWHVQRASLGAGTDLWGFVTVLEGLAPQPVGAAPTGMAYSATNAECEVVGRDLTVWPGGSWAECADVRRTARWTDYRIRFTVELPPAGGDVNVRVRDGNPDTFDVSVTNRWLAIRQAAPGGTAATLTRVPLTGDATAGPVAVEVEVRAQRITARVGAAGVEVDAPRLGAAGGPSFIVAGSALGEPGVTLQDLRITPVAAASVPD